MKIKKNGNKIVKNRNKIGTIGNVGEKNISKMRKTQSQGGKGTGRRAGVLRSHVFFSFFSYFICFPTPRIPMLFPCLSYFGPLAI